MYTFRFNPVFKQWVLLGLPVPEVRGIEPANLLDVGKDSRFVAASYPRQPFVVDPPTDRPHKDAKDLLYPGQPPVGEYELLLYKGVKSLYEWDKSLWSDWLALLQQRIRQFHHNPHLHYVRFTLHTNAVHTTDPYMRVGDLIATSHPLQGEAGALDEELAEQLRERESIFIVQEDEAGRLYVPSAPLHEKEVWYMPAQYALGIESISQKERESLATLLSVLLKELKSEYPQDDYVLTIHTAIAGESEGITWWLQLHKDSHSNQPLTALTLPEAFVHHLHLLLG